MKTTLNLNDRLLADAKAPADQQRACLTRRRFAQRSPASRRRARLAGGAIGAAGTAASSTLMPMVRSSFLRLVTSPKIFHAATPMEDAMTFVDALLAAPGVQLAPLGPEWPKLRQHCLDRQPSGNDLPAAWLSAAVAHLGEHLVGFDRDFRKLLARDRFTLLASA